MHVKNETKMLYMYSILYSVVEMFWIHYITVMYLENKLSVRHKIFQDTFRHLLFSNFCTCI